MVSNKCTHSGNPTYSETWNTDYRENILMAERAFVRQPGDIESIIEALHHEDPNVRWEAARTLGVLRDPRAVEPLLVALNDRDPDVRRKAALSLAKIRDPRALEPLRACSVRDENQVVRWAAAWGVGRLPEQKST